MLLSSATAWDRSRPCASARSIQIIEYVQINRNDAGSTHSAAAADAAGAARREPPLLPLVGEVNHLEEFFPQDLRVNACASKDPFPQELRVRENACASKELLSESARECMRI